MHIAQGFHEPPHNLFSLLLSDPSVSVHPFEEVASSEVLGYHEVGSLGLHDVEYFKNVGVVHGPENLYLIEDGLPFERVVGEGAFGEYLGSEDLAVPES